MNMLMDEIYAQALRTVLVDQVSASAASARSRRRWRRVGSGIAILALVGGGTAYAAGAFRGPPLPGGPAVTNLATAVSVTGSGTQSVPLGAPPAGANRIELTLTCLTPGTFRFADGASVTCVASDMGRSSPTTYSLPLRPGQTSTTITAAPSTRWRLTASYAHVTTTGWAVNAHGQTYGVANAHGTPDLLAAIATNGKQGYIDVAQLRTAEGPMPTSPAQALQQQAHRKAVTIPVYESDGTTVIGRFVITASSATTTITNP